MQIRHVYALALLYTSPTLTCSSWLLALATATAAASSRTMANFMLMAMSAVVFAALVVVDHLVWPEAPPPVRPAAASQVTWACAAAPAMPMHWARMMAPKFKSTKWSVGAIEKVPRRHCQMHVERGMLYVRIRVERML